MSKPIYLRTVDKDNFSTDMGAGMLLAAFYGLEMESALNWSVEQRWNELSKTRTMVATGASTMILSENDKRMPIGMIVYTQTDNENIRRIDALFVLEPYRRNGIAKNLLNVAKEKKELHAYATPSSVSWYKHNGFRVIKKHSEGTVEMTTANYVPEYGYNLRVPIPTECDTKIVKELKELEKKLKN